MFFQDQYSRLLFQWAYKMKRREEQDKPEYRFSCGFSFAFYVVESIR